MVLFPACGGNSNAPTTTTPQYAEETGEAPPATDPEAPDPATGDPRGDDQGRYDQIPAGDRGMVFFPFDSAELTSAAKLALQSDVDWLKENPNRHIVIHGYTDDIGAAPYNLTLGNARADAVRQYLIAQGIESERIYMISHGETGPELPDSLERRAVYVKDDPDTADDADAEPENTY